LELTGNWQLTTGNFLKRYITFAKMLFFADGGFLGGGGFSALWRAGLGLLGGRALVFFAGCGIAAAGGGAVAAAEELEVFHHDGQSASLAAALFVFPLIELEASFDINLLSLAALLVDDFAGSAEGGAIDEADLLAILAAGEFEFAIHRQAEFRHGRLAGEVFQLRIASQVSDQDDFIDVGHVAPWVVLFAADGGFG
jgi:hypothetical protein